VTSTYQLFLNLNSEVLYKVTLIKYIKILKVFVNNILKYKILNN